MVERISQLSRFEVRRAGVVAEVEDGMRSHSRSKRCSWYSLGGVSRPWMRGRGSYETGSCCLSRRSTISTSVFFWMAYCTVIQ
jgi:hypothetical protein